MSRNVFLTYTTTLPRIVMTHSLYLLIALATPSFLLAAGGPSDPNRWKDLSYLGLLTLLLFLVLIIASRSMKKLQQNRFHSLNENHQIKILEQRLLSNKANLYLIEIPGKQVLIAETPQGIEALTESPAKYSYSKEYTSEE